MSSKPAPIFTKPFLSWVTMGDTLTANRDGYTITATLYQDDDKGPPDVETDGYWPSLDPKDPGYIGRKSKRTLERHMEYAKKTLKAFHNGEWGYCGIAVTVECEGVQLTGKYEFSVWGCDYNHPCINKRDVATRHAYLVDYANESAFEALEAAKSKAARVLVTVSGGVAEFETSGHVKVRLVDFDNLELPRTQLEVAHQKLQSWLQTGKE